MCRYRQKLRPWRPVLPVASENSDPVAPPRSRTIPGFAEALERPGDRCDVAGIMCRPAFHLGEEHVIDQAGAQVMAALNLHPAHGAETTAPSIPVMLDIGERRTAPAPDREAPLRPKLMLAVRIGGAPHACGLRPDVEAGRVDGSQSDRGSIAREEVRLEHQRSVRRVPMAGGAARTGHPCPSFATHDGRPRLLFGRDAAAAAHLSLSYHGSTSPTGRPSR